MSRDGLKVIITRIVGVHRDSRFLSGGTVAEWASSKEAYSALPFGQAGLTAPGYFRLFSGKFACYMGADGMFSIASVLRRGMVEQKGNSR